MPPKRTSTRPVHRTDLLRHAMNPGKEARVRSALGVWRQGARVISKEQWRLFFEKGHLDQFLEGKSLAYLTGGTTRTECVRRQVVGMLQSFLSNREEEFRVLVAKSTNLALTETVRHQLHAVNVRHAWFRREPVLMKTVDKTRTVRHEEIPEDIRKLARQIMRHVLTQG